MQTILTDTTVYTFEYNSFGNADNVTVGSSEIANYEYGPNNGKLTKINYANGFSEEYVYNTLEMLSEIWYTHSNGTRQQIVEYVDSVQIFS